MLTISNSASFIRVRDFDGAAVSMTPAAAATPAPVIDWEAATGARLAAARVIASADKLSALLDRPLSNGGSGLATLAPIARSSTALGLSTLKTAASITSTEEVNATPTSFSPRAPEWSGITSTALTMGGVYDGSNGTANLEFRVGSSGIRGLSPIRIDVYDGATLLESVNVGAADPVSQVYSLANGLNVTLGNGTAFIGDSANVDVFDSVGSVVDPDAAFDGIGNGHPGLQEGFSVTAGSFQVNGETINVAADDSISSVLAAINLSAAGVTATFDVASERVGMVQNTAGSGPSITLDNDTSGFLAATKLSGATVVPGKEPDQERVLSSVARFSAVSSGTVSINGDTVAIDVDVDSLDDIIARLGAANADTTATLSTDAQRVTIAPNPSAGGTTVELDEGITGLFSALEITPGLYGDSGGSGNGFSSSGASRIIGAMGDLNESLERLFSGQGFDAVAGVGSLRSSIRSAISDSLASTELEPGRYGLRALERERSPLEIVDRVKLGRGLRNAARPLQDLFGSVDGRTGAQGLLGALHTILVQNRETLGLGNAGGSVGSLVDLFA